MAIVKMRHLRLLAPSGDREKILSLLQKLGCVQIETMASKLDDPEWSPFLRRPETELEGVKVRAASVKNALEILQKHAQTKESMIQKLFTPRPEMSLAELQEEEFLRGAERDTSAVLENAALLVSFSSERTRLESRVTALTPWADLDVPLDYAGSGDLRFCAGTVSRDAGDLKLSLSGIADGADAFMVSQTENERYITVLYHLSAEKETLEVLSPFRYSRGYARHS